MPDLNEDLDYVWRFKLSGGDDESLHSDALTEMVRRELKSLLGCVVLTDSGKDLKVTGFRFLGDAEAEHALYAGPCEQAQSESAPGSESCHKAADQIPPA